ncbi:MAG TPA: signal recognition particle-docking protein FtsY [Lachnospiraceae bacterium]|nr:signal recognition particle-docking protein FtsY [Lachnospiraceae bacterium]
MAEQGFFSKFMNGLFSGFSEIDEDFYEELEEMLIMGDLGVYATESILHELKNTAFKEKIKKPEECNNLLKEIIKERMKKSDDSYDFLNNNVVCLIVGVNGVGKTTSIGKLATKYKKNGKKVLMCAADTFRAAAREQLEEWASRAGVELIGGSEGSDPSSVVFDALKASKSRNVDVLLVDTAGRLHNKKNLMEELKKINRIVDKEYADANKETLVVLDATTGQNALLQAKEFAEATDVNGVILTKMDGTAKGGIAIAIQSELGIPVKYIGYGEGVDDLKEFDVDEYVDKLFE